MHVSWCYLQQIGVNLIAVGRLREIIVDFVIKTSNSQEVDLFTMTIDITYGGISEIDPDSRKFEIFLVSL